MGQILLVRHGQASFGAANYDQLSDLGVAQARLLGDWFADTGQAFHKVVTGGMARHRQTAEACLARLPESRLAGAEWITDAGFDEYDHDDLLVCHRPEFCDAAALKRFLAESEQPRQAFQQVFEAAMMRWMAGAHDADYREPWPAFKSRCVGALERLVEGAGQSRSIIVFSSGGTISAICQHLLGLSDRKMAELNWSLVNCALTRLLYRPGRITLSTLNSYAHLERAGAENAVTYR